MVMQSAANYKDVLELKKLVDSIAPNQIASFPLAQASRFKLGELQEITTALQRRFRMKPCLPVYSLMLRKTWPPTTVFLNTEQELQL